MCTRKVESKLGMDGCQCGNGSERIQFKRDIVCRYFKLQYGVELNPVFKNFTWRL
jgi:hypothetical protein